MNRLDALNKASLKKGVPSFRTGDTVKVHVKVIEGTRSRIQLFQGVVLQRKGTGPGEMVTIRKISNGVGVERIIPISSPFLEKIELNKSGIVRRSKIFYLRKLTGKKARIEEKKM